MTALDDLIRAVEAGRARIHKKRDGHLLIAEDGSCRFLTWRERAALLLAFLRAVQAKQQDDAT